MHKHSLILALLFFLLSCGKSQDTKQDQVDLSSALSDEAPYLLFDADPPPAEAESFKVNVSYVNFTDVQKAKYEKATAIVKKVVATQEFKNKILNFTFNGKKQFVDNRGLSNNSIYFHILYGAETLKPEKNNQMDLEVELYFEDSTTIGYTYPNTPRIWVNTKFFNKYTPASVAANLMHEWMHKIGFTHASAYTTARDYSVPYGIGSIVSSLGKQFE